MDLAAARNLSERLDTPLVEPTEPDSAALRRARVWRDNATRGDDELFRRRLSEWTELDPARFVASLQQSVPATEMSWPPPDTAWADTAWADTAWADTSWADVLTDLPHGSTTEPGDHLGPLVAPLIARAWELVADARAPLGLLSQQALEDLSRDLGQQVSRLIQTAVDTDFREQPAGWQEYRQSLLTTDLTALWVRYPVLARLVGRLLQRWSVGTSELLHRFVTDRDIIADITGSSPGTILGVIPSLSDPHNGGRRVTVLEFAGGPGVASGQGGPSGTRVVYKPKDLSAELLWSAVVTWADSHGLDLGPPARVAAEKDHGWVEFVPSAPTCDPGLFFHRAGALTALVFVLGGGDCHAENLIAAGDRPVVVDAETVLQPTIRDESGSQHRDNVLDTLLLPRWLRIGGRPVDLSPLGGSGVGWSRRELTWEDPETDAARLVPRMTPGIPHGATDIDGHLLRAQEYTAELIGGFRRALAGPAGPRAVVDLRTPPRHAGRSGARPGPDDAGLHPGRRDLAAPATVRPWTGSVDPSGASGPFRDGPRRLAERCETHGHRTRSDGGRRHTVLHRPGRRRHPAQRHRRTPAAPRGVGPAARAPAPGDPR
ncbi:MAG: DUF4135 domain-containing protein [Candidatus Nanopelagicales bacterium]